LFISSLDYQGNKHRGIGYVYIAVIIHIGIFGME
jgi:hypothetical protein